MSGKNISDLKIISFFNTLLGFFSAILTIFSFYGVDKNSNVYIWALRVFVFGVAIVVFCKRCAISKNLLVYILNKTVPKCNIEIYDKNVTYECKENDTYSFVSSFFIKVIGDVPINSYKDRIKWTAGTIENIFPIVKGQKIKFDEEPEAHKLIDKQEFVISFENNKNITKSDAPYKVGFKIPNLIDKQHIAKSMLSVGIYNVTKNLTLRVEFNKKMHPIKVRGLKYAHFIDKIPYDTMELEVNYDDIHDKKYVEFPISTPIYGGLYSIDWELED